MTERLAISTTMERPHPAGDRLAWRIARDAVSPPGGAIKGFTLLEMLVALAVLALIAAVTYAAIQPAGEGFQQLQKSRDALERAYQLDRRLRMDVDYLARSADKAVQTLEIVQDQRGSNAFDQLWLLVADVNSPTLIQVHYFIDEEKDKDVLVRESAMPWQRAGGRFVRWDMGQVESFEVQALDDSNQWRNVWNAKKSGNLPRALRVRWRDKRGGRNLILPIFLGSHAPA